MFCAIDDGRMPEDAAMGFTDWYLYWTLGVPAWFMFGSDLLMGLLVPFMSGLAYGGFITFGLTWYILEFVLLLVTAYNLVVAFGIPGFNLYLLSMIGGAL